MNRLFLYMMILFLFIPVDGLRAENYYMSPGGSDSNAGLSIEQAWATLQHASEEGIGAGDTLFVMGGTYSNDQYFHRTNGSGGASGNPLSARVIWSTLHRGELNTTLANSGQLGLDNQTSTWLASI